MDIIVKILLDLIVKADEYKTEDNMRQTIKSLITKLSSDPQGKAALEEASLSLDQAIIAKFLA